MCRLAAYTGPKIQLRQLVLEPDHNLVVQAQQPKELRYTSVNADGFGFGGYHSDGLPFVYRNTSPIWSDPNLEHLGRILENKLWFANIRSATDGLATCMINTQPFFDSQLLFMHNGFIRQFIRMARAHFHNFLIPEISVGIQGNTDSEYLFAVLRQLRAQAPSSPLDELLLALAKLLGSWISNLPCQFGIVLSDGNQLCAMRHSLNEPCPSMYFTTESKRFPNAQLIASEPLDQDSSWSPIPDHHILTLDVDATVSPILTALPC